MIVIEEIKRNIDIDIAEIANNPEKDGKKLEINEDTEFRIFYDIYNDEDEKYFYIKMVETTADAPFYYIRSYTINELHQLNKIFKVFENDNFEEIKKYMNTLFEKNKIKLNFEQNEEIIKMNLDVILFADKDKVSFELYREMIPNEKKDSKLLDLYSSEKDKNKVIKQIYSFVYNFKGNKDKEIIDNLKKLLKSKEIPGIEEEVINEKKNKNKEKKNDNKENKIIIQKQYENEEEKKKDNKDINIIIEKQDENEDADKKKENNQDNIINIEKKDENEKEEIIIKEKHNDDDIYNCNNLKILQNDINFSKIFTNWQKRYVFSLSKDDYFSIALNLTNIFEEPWKSGSLKFVCNEQLSTIKFKEIQEAPYEVENGQDGDYVFKFEKEGLKKGKYQCYFQLFINGKKATDNEVLLNIKVKS